MASTRAMVTAFALLAQRPVDLRPGVVLAARLDRCYAVRGRVAGAPDAAAGVAQVRAVWRVCPSHCFGTGRKVHARAPRARILSLPCVFRVLTPVLAWLQVRGVDVLNVALGTVEHHVARLHCAARLALGGKGCESVDGGDQVGEPVFGQFRDGVLDVRCQRLCLARLHCAARFGLMVSNGLPVAFRVARCELAGSLPCLSLCEPKFGCTALGTPESHAHVAGSSLILERLTQLLLGCLVRHRVSGLSGKGKTICDFLWGVGWCDYVDVCGTTQQVLVERQDVRVMMAIR